MTHHSAAHQTRWQMARARKAPPVPATEGLMARPMEGSKAPAAKGMAARLYTSAQARFCRILPSAARDSSKASTTCADGPWVRTVMLVL